MGEARESKLEGVPDRVAKEDLGETGSSKSSQLARATRGSRSSCCSGEGSTASQTPNSLKTWSSS